MSPSSDASALAPWVTAAADALGIEVDAVALVDTVLDLTADVAHGVSRPAAPVTAFLIGLAAARTADPASATHDLSARISALAATWERDRG